MLKAMYLALQRQAPVNDNYTEDHQIGIEVYVNEPSPSVFWDI
jgi:hypothetical protein